MKINQIKSWQTLATFWKRDSVSLQLFNIINYKEESKHADIVLIISSHWLIYLSKVSCHNSKPVKVGKPSHPLQTPPRLGIFQKVGIFLLFLKFQSPLYDSLFAIFNLVWHCLLLYWALNEYKILQLNSDYFIWEIPVNTKLTDLKRFGKQTLLQYVYRNVQSILSSWWFWYKFFLKFIIDPIPKNKYNPNKLMYNFPNLEGVYPSQHVRSTWISHIQTGVSVVNFLLKRS